ncbi:MAG: hypothetical protein U1B79_01230 [Candidatus Pacearchaeota archaeon]|nr:hypothetical protein [Nanoarchaeota archaeon]MDZ4226713.1 hypothetical protein [Candidatus Pacearchaeota archaeon]
MSSENVIHIRLDYMETLKAKRSILSSELSSLNIAKRIARYRAIRMEELGLKSRLYGKMKEAKLNIKKLQSILPNPKVPRLVRREHAMEKNEILNNEGDIESQLREIQRRLERLQGQNI